MFASGFVFEFHMLNSVRANEVASNDVGINCGPLFMHMRLLT